MLLLLSGCLKGFYEEKKKIPSIERTVQLKCSNYSFRLTIFPRVRVEASRALTIMNAAGFELV